MMTEKNPENFQISWEMIIDVHEIRIIDLNTDNHDTLAIFEKTGDEDYDDLVTRPNVELFTTATCPLAAAIS